MAGLAGILVSQPAWADERAPADEDRDAIIVTAANAGTKKETPLVELPQPVTVITSEQFISQGEISISDTVKYAAGVLANRSEEHQTELQSLMRISYAVIRFKKKK